MITQIKYYNFKSLKEVICDLSRLTVIVGPNASGKSTMLQGLDLLSRLSEQFRPEDIVHIFSGPQDLDLLHSGDANAPMGLYCYNGPFCFSFSALKSSGKFDIPLLPRSSWHADVHLDSGDGDEQFGVELDQKPTQNSAVNDLAAVALLQLDPAILTEPSYSGDVNPIVRPNGEGLAASLASMALSSPEVFDSLQNRLRQIVPHFRRLRFRRVKVSRDESEIIRIGDEAITRKVSREYPADMLIFDFDQRQDIPATNVSEGTMLALGLLTVLHSSSRPRVVLLDDIEKGLHPSAQRELVGLLREILRDNPDLQIVATSHSPYFLDFLDPSEVRLMAIGPDGFSRCGLLTDHPDFQKWKDEMTPGEMWSFFGEKWLVEEKV